eukprot:CAMPEP_0116843588 /NCGR_PEP_ID=MMETSP0418-20121206/12171_1 /TAXON_ID=1158023 /ORGANISM="Astrosyne radiata, Strain 13vi08-1A" /LENGTH=79 /DNA_ID=CAMNT_0004474357 /DNA_START=393 /DNA_END=629 /DNA_ORIENTATION=-
MDGGKVGVDVVGSPSMSGVLEGSKVMDGIQVFEGIKDGESTGMRFLNFADLIDVEAALLVPARFRVNPPSAMESKRQKE